MKIKLLIITAIIIVAALIFFFIMTMGKPFQGLKPLYEYNGYQIYDLVKQQKLACAEMVEYFPTDPVGGYQYYFDCLRSDNIFMVKGNNKIKIKDAYSQGLITIEKMYEFGLISRTSVAISPLYEIQALKPLYEYNGYQIYDLSIQKGEMCATAIETIYKDSNYTYYLSCLKSDRIYFIKDQTALNLKEAFQSKIISIEKLYELGIIERMNSNE